MILSVKILLCNIIILDQTVMKNIPAIITKRNFQKWKKREKAAYRKSIAYHVFFFGAKIQKCFVHISSETSIFRPHFSGNQSTDA